MLPHRTHNLLIRTVYTVIDYDAIALHEYRTTLVGQYTDDCIIRTCFSYQSRSSFAFPVSTAATILPSVKRWVLNCGCWVTYSSSSSRCNIAVKCAHTVQPCFSFYYLVIARERLGDTMYTNKIRVTVVRKFYFDFLRSLPEILWQRLRLRKDRKTYGTMHAIRGGNWNFFGKSRSFDNKNKVITI